MARIFKLGQIIPNYHFFDKVKEEPEQVVDVCIFTEATYPFVKGGVSTVIHQIIEAHPNITFGIVHIAWDKNSPSKNLYPELKQIKWVKTILLHDPKNHHVSRKVDAKLVANFLEHMHQLESKNAADIKQFYDKYINPNTRKYDFRDIIKSKSFFEYMIGFFKHFDITLSELFWLQKEYLFLATSLFNQVFPKARVYHSHTNGYAGLAAAMASMQHDKKFILTEHSLYIRDVLTEIQQLYGNRTEIIGQVRKKVWESWFKIIGKVNYECAYKHTYLYDQIAADACLYGALKDKTKIIPNGINYNNFELTRQKQSDRHKDRFSSKNKWKLGFIGRIVPVKGVKDLIEAVAYLKANFDQPFEVHLIGPTEEDPKYYHDCVKLTEQHGLQEVVIFHGSQNVASFLMDIDLVILSSLSEALPVVILEAMAAAIPIISTNVGSVNNILCAPLKDRELNQDVNEAGMVVPVKSPESLAKGIIEMLKNQKKYEEYQNNGPKRVLSAFRIEDIMSQYSSLYFENLS